MPIRRQLSLALACVGFAVIIASESVAAGVGFVSTVTQTSCTYQGGAYGHGYTRAHAYMREEGTSGTNYMRIVGQLLNHQGGWHVVATKRWQTDAFPDDGDSYFTARTITFPITAQQSHYESKIRITFQWWDKRPGADVKIHHETKFGKRCDAVQ